MVFSNDQQLNAIRNGIWNTVHLPSHLGKPLDSASPLRYVSTEHSDRILPMLGYRHVQSDTLRSSHRLSSLAPG
jgi:hypothetical protein